MIKSKYLLGACALYLLSAPGFAVPLSGELGMTGFLTSYCTASSSNCGMDSADALDFGGNGFGTDGPLLITFASGDFSPLSVGDVGSITDFVFDPLTPSPVSPLWSVGAFSFDLQSVDIVDRDVNFLTLRGTGTVMAAGFDDTFGEWTLSADSAGGEHNFAWSSTTVTASEPGIVLLFGLALLAMTASRRFA